MQEHLSRAKISAKQKSYIQEGTVTEQPWEIPDKAIEGIVVAYWERFYQGKACTLCGDSGWLDTTGVCTPAGVAVGRRQFCLCPNGIMLRKLAAHEEAPPQHTENKSRPVHT